MRRTRVAMVVLVLAATVAVSPDPSSAAPEQAAGCQRWDDYGRCVKDLPIPVPAGSAMPDDSGRGSPSGRTTPLPICRWERMPELDARFPPDLLGPPAGMVNPVRLYQTCATPDRAGFRWVDAGPGAPAAPVPPPPAAVALVLYARVETLMQSPRLATNPPGNSAAVVDLPVFVAVENWQGEITDRQCVLLVCVEMRASPSLEFAPGEPGASVIPCEPPGSRFDATLGDAATQASVPGACTYTYQQRTGVADRPEQWPGEVTVRWAVSWSSNVGASGSFPELAFSATAPRAVDEVQTVVADSS